MSQLFEFLQRLRQEPLSFDLSYTALDRVRVSVSAGSEHWIVEFSAEGVEFIEVFRGSQSPTDEVQPLLENLFNRVQRAWLEASGDLGIEMVGHYEFRDREGSRFEAPVFLPEFGSSKGTLLFLETSSGYAIDAAHHSGYHVSLIGASSYDNYGREHFIQTLRDFGWEKAGKNPPAWYHPDA
jgi:hypothetical protein